MTASELYSILAQELKGLADEFVSDDYINAATDAQRETWDLPQTDDFKVLWIKNRAKRHLYSYLRDQSALKIDVKNYKQSTIFKNLSEMVDKMDADFEKAQSENPDQFAGVDAYKLFGSQIDAGFSTDFLGRDTTYGEDNEVIITPSESA